MWLPQKHLDTFLSAHIRKSVAPKSFWNEQSRVKTLTALAPGVLETFLLHSDVNGDWPDKGILFSIPHSLHTDSFPDKTTHSELLKVELSVTEELRVRRTELSLLTAKQDAMQGPNAKNNSPLFPHANWYFFYDRLCQILFQNFLHFQKFYKYYYSVGGAMIVGGVVCQDDSSQGVGWPCWCEEEEGYLEIVLISWHKIIAGCLTASGSQSPFKKHSPMLHLPGRGSLLIIST